MKNLSILVVDDDQQIRHMLQQLLMTEFHLVEIAKDGYKAKEMLNERSYDVVITDLMMPGGIGGIEVLEAAKALDKTTEVLLITGHSSVDTAIEAMRKGAYDYLKKPINFDELFLRLAKIADLQTMVRNVQDLQVAMNTTESVASDSIRYLEIEVNRLQDILSNVDQLLRLDNSDPAKRIEAALIAISKA